MSGLSNAPHCVTHVTPNEIYKLSAHAAWTLLKNNLPHLSQSLCV